MVISPARNPKEPLEQYVPAPVMLPDGSVWVYVKGGTSIYAWRSTDGGKSFALANAGEPVLSPEQNLPWEGTATVEPAAVYEEEADTIHLYYKGASNLGALGSWGCGHATARGSDPTKFAKDPKNPLLTAKEVSLAFDFARVASDLVISDVIRKDGRLVFYGTFEYAETFHLFLGSGASYSEVRPESIILFNGLPKTVVQGPTVFRDPKTGMYWMVFASGSHKDQRILRTACSWDAMSWAVDPEPLLTPSPTERWEGGRVYCPAMLKTGPGHDQPVIIDGKVLLYYSGSPEGGVPAGVGLLLLGLLGGKV